MSNRFDFHCHCLPGMDDGAADVEMAASMLKLLSQQGVCGVAATSHYDARQEDVASFVARRDTALYALLCHPEASAFPKIYPGAEIYLSKSIEPKELKPLCIGDVKAILLELPRAPYKPWMADCIANIAYGLSVTPILAHLERYASYYKPHQLWEVIEAANTVAQVNLGSLASHDTRKLVKTLHANGIPLALGSDAHNLTNRRPNWDKAQGYLQKSHRGLTREEWFVSLSYFEQTPDGDSGLIF